MRGKRSYPLAAQITATLVGAVFVSLALLGGILISISFRSQQSQLILVNQSLAQIGSEKIGAYIDALQRKLSYLSRLRGFTAFPGPIQRSHLEGLLNQNQAYALVGQVDRRGRLVDSVLRVGDAAPAEWGTTAAFRRTFELHEEFIGTVDFGAGSAFPSLIMSVPVRDQDNRIDGMLFARISLEYLWSVLDETRVGETGYAYILDQRLRVVAQSGVPPERVAPRELSADPLGAIIDSHDDDQPFASSYRGLRKSMVVGQVVRMPTTNWRIVIEMPVAEAYAPLIRLLITMGVALALGLGFSVLLGLLLARRFSIPLLLLTRAAENLRSGELGSRVNLTQDDELGILANVFNHMAATLSDTIVALNRDVAERIKAELALRESELRYRGLLEGAQGVVYTFSTRRGGIYYSPYVHKMLGYPTEYLLSNPRFWNESIHPDDRDRVGKSVLEFAEGTQFVVEYRIKDARGRWHWLQDRSIGRRVEADEVLIEGLATDISELKLIEGTLRDSEQQMAIAEQIGHVGSWIYDIGEDKIRGSPEALLIFGFPSNSPDLPIDKIGACMPERERVRKALVDLIGESGEYTLEFSINPADGAEPKQLLSIARLKKDDLGKPLKVLGFLQDITDRKRSQAALEKALSENQYLLSELQHRAKNSFNMICSMISFSLGAGASPELTAVLDELDARVRSVAELYSLLYESGSTTAVRLDDYCARVVSSLVGLSANVSLAMDMEYITVTVGSAAPLGLILTELMTNAIKYAFPAGRAGTIAISLKRAESGARLEIRDDGVGLPEGFSAESAAGTGLALVRGLVAQIGGEFTIEGGACGTFCSVVFRPEELQTE